LENPNELIGQRTHDLPVRSAVSQPAAPWRTASIYTGCPQNAKLRVYLRSDEYEFIYNQLECKMT